MHCNQMKGENRAFKLINDPIKLKYLLKRSSYIAYKGRQDWVSPFSPTGRGPLPPNALITSKIVQEKISKICTKISQVKQ